MMARGSGCGRGPRAKLPPGDRPAGGPPARHGDSCSADVDAGGGHGVARRPTKFAACAKVEPSTAHDAGGPCYYCSKCFEKPRIPAGDAALLEDERRRDLWRLGLPRNTPIMNCIVVLLALWLCANKDTKLGIWASEKGKRMNEANRELAGGSKRDQHEPKKDLFPLELPASFLLAST